MSKQTAVQWLIFEIDRRGPKEDNPPQWLKELYNQAKAMEREQMITSWHNGYDNQSPMIDEENCGEQYYNETYKGGEQ